MNSRLINIRPLKLLQALAAGALSLALTSPIAAQSASPQLTAVLAQMDAASARFHNARADFRWDNYERVVKDTTTQNGSIYFERKGTAMEMGAVILDPATRAKVKVLAYSGATLQMFDPGVNQITVLRAGSNQAQYESFLTLGFGGSGQDLARTWNITDNGPETLSDGNTPVRTEKLDLVAKDPGARSTFTHVTVWIDPARAVSLKQIFYTPSGDTRTAVYTNIRVNTKIDMGTFAIKKNGQTTVINR